MAQTRAHVLRRDPSAAPDSLRSWVLWSCVAVVSMRLTYVFQPLRADEGGYLLIARQWHAGGEFLYGDYHVDRPPLLLAIFRLAALTDWDPAIRVLSIPFAVLFVVAAARAGRLAAGPAAGRWSAVVAAALVSSPALAADQADGELFAVPFVMGSIALTLEAWRRQPGTAQATAAVAAGALAAGASLVKQGFLEGFVFAALLVATDVLRRRRVAVRSRILLAGGAAGAILPNLLVYLWAVVVDVDGLRIWSELAIFRAQAFAVIWGQSTDAPLTRAVTLVGLSLLSGMLPLAAAWVYGCRDGAVRGRDETWAVLGCLGFGVLAIVAGGSYWPHYLMQVAPVLALAAGLGAASSTGTGVVIRRRCRITAGSAVAACLVVGVAYAAVPWVRFHERTGEWLAASAEPGDTAVIAYGSPSVLEAADMPSPYPYLWSLPMRTLDPDQVRLRATLAGPSAPTWFVQLNDLDSWDIDSGSRLRSLLQDRYDVVATVCGHDVWLRRDRPRQPAPPPLC